MSLVKTKEEYSNRVDSDPVGLTRRENMDVARIREVMSFIKDEPRRLRMSNWIVNKDAKQNIISNNVEVGQNEDNKQCFIFLGGQYDGEDPIQEIPPCGTVGCFAGWTVVRFDGVEKAVELGVYTQSRAQEILGMNERQADELFYMNEWDREIAMRYHLASTQEARVTILEEQVEHFIKKYAENPV